MSRFLGMPGLLFRKRLGWLGLPSDAADQPDSAGLVNPLPCIPPLYQLAMIAGLGNVMLGYNLSVLNTAMPIITGDFEWCGVASRQTEPGLAGTFLHCPSAKYKQGLLSTALIMGSACGSFISGSFLARLGRRLTLLLVFCGIAFGCSFSAVSTSFATLYMARITTGLFTGIATVAPAVYLTEMAPPHQRATYAFVPTIAGNLGITLGICCGIPLVFPHEHEYLSWSTWEANAQWWRFMVALPLIPCAFAAYCLIALYTFDTPEALRAAGKSSEAVEMFLWSFTPKTPSNVSVRETRYSPRSISLLSALMRPTLRSRLVISWVLAIGQQMSGMPVLIAASNDLFAQAGVPQDTLTYASVCMALLQVLCSIFASIRINHWSRRNLMGLGAAAMAASLMPSVLANFFFGALRPANLPIPLSEAANGLVQHTAVFSTLLFAAIYGMSIGPSLLIYLTELFPSDLKDTGLAVAFALNWTACLTAISCSAFLSQAGCYLMFACVCTVMSVFVYSSCPETRKALKSLPLPVEQGLEMPVTPALGTQTSAGTFMRAFDIEKSAL